MVDFLIGDLLTGRRIQYLPALAGSTWSEAINDAGSVKCVVSLRDPAVKRKNLFNEAAVAKTYLAAVDGDTVLQVGPIWDHAWDRDSGLLTLSAAGMLSYFDHRALLPVLAGRRPDDPTTDTRFMPAAPLDPDYPWPTDTRLSLQGIMVSVFAQALSWPSGNIPLTLPSIIPGTSQRAYRGSDIAPVSSRAKELSQVLNGPEVRITGQFLSDRSGLRFLAEIGTPTQPLLFSAQRQTFWVGNAKSSVTKLNAKINGSQMGSQAFAAGGRALDKAIVSVSTDSRLTDAKYPLMDLMDSSHTTAQDLGTLQEYSDEAVARAGRPTGAWSFTHNVSKRPFQTSFRAGDFAEVRVIDDDYLPAGKYVMRITGRSGSVDSTLMPLSFQPEAI